MRAMALLVWLGLVIGANAHAGDIRLKAPSVSGEASTITERKESSREGLSSVQLRELDGWLDHHRTGWHGMMTEAASEPAQLSLSLKDCDGAVTSISVIERANGSRYLRVLGPEPWTYESFLGLSKSRAATRPVSNQELTALEQIVRGTRSGLRALEEQRSVSSTLSFAVNRSHHPEAESWK